MCQFTTLVSPDEAATVTEVTKKSQTDVNGRFFGFREEDPYPARGAVVTILLTYMS